MFTVIRHRDRKEWRTDNGDTWGAYRVGKDRWVGYHTPKDGRQELLKIYPSPDHVFRMAISEEPQQIEMF